MKGEKKVMEPTLIFLGRRRFRLVSGVAPENLDGKTTVIGDWD